MAILAGSCSAIFPFNLKDFFPYPRGNKGSYYPGPGNSWSGGGLVLWRTFLTKASLPDPKQYVLSPLTCTANVEVVLFGLNTVGIS